MRSNYDLAGIYFTRQSEYFRANSAFFNMKLYPHISWEQILRDRFKLVLHIVCNALRINVRIVSLKKIIRNHGDEVEHPTGFLNKVRRYF